MPKVIFSIKYDIEPEKREEYLTVIKELKSLIGSEGIESYTVYEQKNKKNHFVEIYTFANAQAYEDFDDDPSERVNILMNKLSDMVKQHSTEYATLFEV
ncbi:MAG: antibiotic biosynthesis monooxygenase [Bacteroidetes bacterium]|nr:antibiotic biosynthesis monooxygenase [Bacteroidota bacterium]MBU1680957.1 antibiotic biosynthesis monooxygenase [Bacteroidota bacterium]MBU2506125.1 antibiotic biosynthesis monooxygenase [Bacteroidota bacterium]